MLDTIMRARTATPVVLYNDKDISAGLLPYLKQLSYTDNMSGKADDLELTLEDREGLWEGDWMPDKGATLKASLTTSNWHSLFEGPQSLDLGQFEVDTITCKGMPSEVTVKAVSIPDNNKLRGEEHSRSWEKAKLSAIAGDVAAGAGMTLKYTAPDDPQIDRAEQTDESDLAFLQKLCSDHGVAVKIYKDQLILFDEVDYERVEPKITIVRPGSLVAMADTADMLYVSQLTGWSFESKIRDTYKACHVKYKAGKDKGVIEATFTAPDKKEGKTLQIHEQVASIAEAEKLAKRKLREKNQEEVTGSIDCMGCLALLTSLTVQLTGFGRFDGKYLITEAKHEMGSSGYTTSINVRRCLNGY